MADKHDNVFKDLISNRDFAVSFLQNYMPEELVHLVDWKSIVLASANVEHVRQRATCKSYNSLLC
ncbi:MULTISPECIES: Rpn family recombination-promoting nuclease/putative transposase [Cysteiniphilum]|uniref:Rpn family recombination-promoting nuclease/putative transposase n=1 Tax=Cysteiniphilum TaxID=2056696 RepID=UPI001780339D|nr:MULTISPECIES: Rpn family recombination-promoting nuclease/putative transposase [Cysteiniphilum]